MPSIEIVAGIIAGSGLPVLFLDTCILLDIIRSTSRCLGGYAEKASELLMMASASPPRCLIVVSSMIPREWGENVEGVVDAVNLHLRQIDEQSSHFPDACSALGIAVPFGRADYHASGVTLK